MIECPIGHSFRFISKYLYMGGNDEKNINLKWPQLKQTWEA
jgi:hypothetical protein